MSKKQILDYIMSNPWNINLAVLSSMLDAFAESDNVDISDATATVNDILQGKTAYANDTKFTGTIVSKEAQTYTSTTTEQTINAGQYLSGAQTIAAVPTEEKSATPSATAQEISPTEGKFLSKVIVAGDANLLAENIKSGVTIFGVVGTYTGEIG